MEEGLINTSRATPRWVARAVAAGEFIGLRPGHNTHRFYFVALVQFALSAAALWALSMGAVEAGHCESYACSWRLILFQVIIMCVFQIDFLTFPYFARSTSNLWVVEGGKSLESGHIGSVLRESLAAQPGGLVFFGVLVSGFLAPWLRGGWWWALIFGGVLMINCVTHLLANGLVADFIAIHLSRKQEDFQEGLLAGQFTYDQAVRAFNAINSERRQLQGVLSKTTTTFVFGVLLAEAVLLYDFMLKPWGSWEHMALYVLYGLWLFGAFGQWIKMNAWVEGLAEKVAEEVDGDLRWSPSERTNFMAFLQATKCSITLLNFELNSSFYVAIPALLFGWFLYILELKQFHEFDGFPFDHFCDGNVTSEGGGGGHHG